MSKARIIHGDTLEVLQGLRERSFDACLTDPPYGLRFMGRRWDHGVPSPEVWSEVLRCLRPGASLMAFGGTRTYHRLAVAVEDAGFEIRDSILVPGVAWTFGAGFPKSLSVKRVTGSERWEGYGTALKPAHEPIVWAMKPVDGTFARNALEHGVAGVNVDAGRVGYENTQNPATNPLYRRAAGYKNTNAPDDCSSSYRLKDGSGERNPSQLGRFPANLILAHLPGCLRAGERRVLANPEIRYGRDDGAVYGSGINDKPTRRYHADLDGTETITAWECVEGCPVLAMDRASGELTSGIMRGGTRRAAQDKPGSACYGVYGGDATKSDTPADSGTASRFFQQVAWEPGEFERTLLYYSKAPTSERMVDGERLLHPTMKPLALATYLARMLLPPPRGAGEPRRLLVPFSGVGSEVIGALRAGWDEVVAVELDADGEGWVEKSARRIEADAPLFNEVEVVNAST